MRVEVVAVGTELLLGQILNTNAAWLGAELAAAGMDAEYQSVVGDNVERIALVFRGALARSDAVVACGGLGPTQDDCTREAVAAMLNIPLKRDEAVLDVIRSRFQRAGRPMPESNARQADVPEGARVIPQTMGTAPGLCIPVGEKALYLLPGPPAELHDMWERAVAPELRQRAAARGETASISSRVLRTWGLSESALAERLADRFRALEEAGGNPSIAFLASGIEGIKVRITAKGATEGEALSLLEAEEARVRELLGPAVFGVDGETIAEVVGRLLVERGFRLGVAESLTGGMVASYLVNVPGASAWFTGGVVAYDARVKRDLLGVPDGPVVSEDAALAMAAGACRLLGSEVGLGLTGVAGPDAGEGNPPGTVYVAAWGPLHEGQESGEGGDARLLHLPGGRQQVRELATISALDLLRRRLDSQVASRRR